MKMNKIICAIVTACLFAGASSYGANAITWQSALGATIYEPDATPIDTTDNYYVMLVMAANGTTIGFDPVTQTVGAGETLVWFANWTDMQDGSGAFLIDLLPGEQPTGAAGIGGVNNGSYLYTVVLNASAPGAGVTMYSILEGTTPTQVAVNTSNGIGTYSAPGNNTWQPVPEPSTVALMVAGLAVVVAGRRKLRK